MAVTRSIPRATRAGWRAPAGAVALRLPALLGVRPADKTLREETVLALVAAMVPAASSAEKGRGSGGFNHLGWSLDRVTVKDGRRASIATPQSGSFRWDTDGDERRGGRLKFFLFMRDHSLTRHCRHRSSCMLGVDMCTKYPVLVVLTKVGMVPRYVRVARGTRWQRSCAIRSASSAKIIRIRLGRSWKPLASLSEEMIRGRRRVFHPWL